MIDYDAIREALVFAVMNATGLDQNHVVMYQPETANQPRPTLPYVDVHIIVPSRRFGDDSSTAAEETENTTTYDSSGPRGMLVGFDAYAKDHESAYEIMGNLQAALDTEATQMLLAQNGVAVWRQNSVMDLSMLIETGFEGRAHMDVEFGMASSVRTRVDNILSVDLQGPG